MKKIIYMIIVLFSFFISVLFVFAKSNVITDISIKNTGGSIYTNTPSVDGNKIQAKAIFKEIYSSVTYQISLDFDSVLYEIDSVNDSNNNRNVQSDYTYQDNKLFMTLKYNNEATSNLSLDDIDVQVNLKESYQNPGTGNEYALLFMVVLTIGILIFGYISKKKKVLFLFFLLPLLVYAKDKQVLEFTFSGEQINIGYEIHFYRDNDVEGEIESIGCIKGNDCDIPYNSFTKEGQFIVGWSTSNGGSKVYEPEEFSLGNAPLLSNDITLYPIWADIVVSYNYTGNSSVFNALKSGRYKLEVWGAEGEYGVKCDLGDPGKGGYSSGVISLEEGTTLYVYVGQKGSGGNSNAIAFNGGGYGEYRSPSNSSGGGGGGGASDISLYGGLWNSTEHLYSRIIVAGGGGGGNAWCFGTSPDGGAGGGTVSGGSWPATQTGAGRGGSFGLGCSDIGDSYPSGGGGGGWYGGGCNQMDIYTGSPSGGSGYIYTSETASNYPSGCLLNNSYYLSDASTISGDQSFTAPDGSTETGHSGHGYARITYLG